MARRTNPVARHGIHLSKPNTVRHLDLPCLPNSL